MNRKTTFSYHRLCISISFIVCFILSSLASYSKELYIAPTGNDANNGSISNPLESIKKAQELATAGDIVYIRGGVYNMREDQIAQYYSIWAYVTKLDKDGISYVAYQNETPVFDYSNIKPANYRITAFYINGNNIHIKGIEVTGVQVTITTHTQSECFEIQGSNNILEQIKMHDNMAIGVYMIKGSNNLILNCDAYRNYDSVSEGGSGGNTDGFGCHLKKGSVNNVLRGCRAWFNSDDGFDLINNAEAVTIENCWAFYNGYSSGFVSRGDGNGFKAGGYGAGGTPYATILSNYAPIPKNIIRFCLAVRNKQSGFYANHHLEGNYWYNNTAYKNKRNFNMLNCVALNETDFATDGPGWNHTLANNLGFAATTEELTNIDKTRCTLNTNYFDMNSVTVNSADFLSVDENLLTAEREADGNLPNNDFLKLVSSSDLIDAGTAVGFSYKGGAPDLGCFESNVGKDADNDGVYDRQDFCPNTPTGTIVNSNGCIAISETAIKVNVKTPTCPGKANGKISIASSLNGYSYTISIKGNGINQTLTNQQITPTTPFERAELAAGNYEVTVSIPSIAFEQKYGVLVNEISAITAKRVESDKAVSYTVSGSNEYAVTINGVTNTYITGTSKTSKIEIDASLLQKTNTVTIETNSDCQGAVQDSFTISPSVLIYPNPTPDIIYFNGLNKGLIQVYTNTAALIIEKDAKNTKSIDLKGYAAGMYLVKITQGTTVETFKVILK